MFLTYDPEILIFVDETLGLSLFNISEKKIIRWNSNIKYLVSKVVVNSNLSLAYCVEKTLGLIILDTTEE